MRKWLVLFALFQAGDAASTLYATQYLGFGELNPLMAYMLKMHPVAFIAFKLLGTLLILAAASRASNIRVLRILTILMGIVVFWNAAGIIWHVT